MTEHERRLSPTYPPSMAIIADGVEVAIPPADWSRMRIDRICRNADEIKLLTGPIPNDPDDRAYPPALPDGYSHIGLVMVLRAASAIFHNNIATSVDWPYDEVFDEWRVTGEPGAIEHGGVDVNYPTYSFTWSKYQGPDQDRDDPEGAARAFIAGIARGKGWAEGPYLHRRTITRTPWQTA